MQNLNFFDQIIAEIDNLFKSVIPPKQRISARPNPSNLIPENSLAEDEKRHIAGLMRVNHAGEVAAQALYQGQALTANIAHIKAQMHKAAQEETDHLAWCEQRLEQLNAKTSFLNPLWYLSSFLIGALAGIAGDGYNLGFVLETERQVSQHLKSHFEQLPANDLKTKSIILQMEKDETAHATNALEAGAKELPPLVKKIMQLSSKLLTKMSYYI